MINFTPSLHLARLRASSSSATQSLCFLFFLSMSFIHLILFYCQKYAFTSQSKKKTNDSVSEITEAGAGSIRLRQRSGRRGLLVDADGAKLRQRGGGEGEV